MSHQETGKRKRSADGSDSADALRATQGHQYNSSRVFGGTAQFGDNRYGDNNSVIVVQKVTGSSPGKSIFILSEYLDRTGYGLFLRSRQLRKGIFETII